MTHPDDMTAREIANLLKAKLDDRNPKCGNCKHWDRDGQDAPKVVRSGVCRFNTFLRMEKYPSPYPASEMPVHVTIVTRTPDLSLCSAWEKREMAEDEIVAAAKSDPDNLPLTDEQLARMKRRHGSSQ